MSFARHPRALRTALVLAAVALCAVPLASPAASTSAGAKKLPTAKIARAKPPARKPAGYHPHPGPAPADEYFGRLGMSVLGVRSKVKDLGLDADLHPEHDQAILNNALWLEDAMRDWAKKYPFDRWLPRYAYALEQMYEEIPGDAAHKRAVKQVSYITAYFPQTLYGRIGRAKLSLGVPVPDPTYPPIVLGELDRLALIDGKVAPTMPPAVLPSPSPSPSPAPVDAGVPAPDGTPTPAPASASAAPAP
jgi:hypothetical protein